MDIQSLHQLTLMGLFIKNWLLIKHQLLIFFQLSPDTLLILTNDGSIYVKDLKGTIKKTITNDRIKGKNLGSIVKLRNGRILISGFDRNIFELNPDGSIKQQIWLFPVVKGEGPNHNFNGFLLQLKNGNILEVIACIIF